MNRKHSIVPNSLREWSEELAGTGGINSFVLVFRLSQVAFAYVYMLRGPTETCAWTQAGRGSSDEMLSGHCCSRQSSQHLSECILKGMQHGLHLSYQGDGIICHP